MIPFKNANIYYKKLAFSCYNFITSYSLTEIFLELLIGSPRLCKFQEINFFPRYGHRPHCIHQQCSGETDAGGCFLMVYVKWEGERQYPEKSLPLSPYPLGKAQELWAMLLQGKQSLLDLTQAFLNRHLPSQNIHSGGDKEGHKKGFLWKF